jgi:hypothetical protein
MLEQVARTSREYPVPPGITEDQGVLWHMSTVLLTAFGFLYVVTSFQPPLHREGREHIPQERRDATLYQSLHDVSRLTEGCNGGVPKHARNHTQVRKGWRCGEAYVHQ